MENGGSSGQLYSPGEVAELLDIPSSTLRVYAATFEGVLSASARRGAGPPTRPFRHRRYSLDDIAMLGRVKALLESGLTYRAILAQLTGSARPPGVRRHDRRRFPRPDPAPPARPGDDQRPWPNRSDGIAEVANPPDVDAVGEIIRSALDRLAAIEDALAAYQKSVERLDSRLDLLDAVLARIEAALPQDHPRDGDLRDRPVSRHLGPE